MSEKLYRALRKLGLSENEAKVYVATLSLGVTTIKEIASASKVKRTTVYSVIEQLLERGLVRKETQGFKTYFGAEAPDRLQHILENQRQLIISVSDELNSLYNMKGRSDTISLYSGIAAIESVYEDTLTQVSKDDFYLVTSNSELWYRLDEDFFESFINRRAKLYTDIRLLLKDSATVQEHRKHERQWNLKIKILPKTLLIRTIIVVIPRYVFIHQLVPPYQAVKMENPNLIEMHREIFENLWALTP